MLSIFKIIITISLLFTSSLFSSVQTSDKLANELEKVSLQFQWLDQFQFAGYYIAKEKGFYEDVGLDVEALVRWNNPILGLLSPSEFLPVIQSDDELNLFFDQWVVNEALKQLVLWHEQNIELKVCINISPKQFKGNQFQDWFFELIESEKISKTLLQNVEFEILETAVIDNIEESNKFISSLQKHGISFALDDFGTGYSSLIHLKSLHLNTIKIDQVFVREMFDSDASMTIVKAVIALSKAFDLSVTAEGAETDEHVEKLLKMGCDEIQGYAISRPLPASDINTFIDNFEYKENKKY